MRQITPFILQIISLFLSLTINATNTHGELHLNFNASQWTLSQQDIIHWFTSISSQLLEINQRLTHLEDEVFKNQSQNFTALEEPPLDFDLVKSQILEDPITRLYSEENYTGLFEDYNFTVSNSEFEGGCYDLKILRRRVKSVDTYGKCIRLFHGQLCIGWSLAVYPGNQNTDILLNSKLSQVESIGPCLPNEFDNAIYEERDSEILLHKSHTDVPDLIEICSLEKFYKATRPLEIPKLLTHLQGPFNRIELLVALIHPSLLNTSQTQTFNMEESSFYKSLDKKSADIIGYGIPSILGGPMNESFNIFPQRKAAKEEWLNITSEIRAMILNESSKNNKVDDARSSGPEILAQVALNFVYHNETVSRPSAFYYWVHLRSKKLIYGRVLN